MSNSRFRRWTIDWRRGPIELDVDKYGIKEEQNTIKIEGRGYDNKLYYSYESAVVAYYVYGLQSYRHQFLELRRWIDKLPGCGKDNAQEVAQLFDTLTVDRIVDIYSELSEMVFDLEQGLMRLSAEKRMCDLIGRFPKE